MKTLSNSVLILTAILGISTCVRAEVPAEDLAKALLAKAGITHGIAALPRCTDGKLALAMAQNSKFLVQALAANRQNVEAIAKLADNAGLLAHNLYVAQGTPASLPFADNFVDLILMTDLVDGDLAALPPKEILRVLAPSRGRAILGRAKASAGVGSLSKAALENWAQGFAQANPKIVEDASGLWLMVNKPALPGSDPWSHRYHGPGNNPVSADTTIKGPLLTQWLGLPRHEGWWGTAIVSAGGRMFTIWSPNGGFQGPGGRQTLTARDLYNGTTLWERPLPPAEKGKVSYNPARCCMVATPERLYMIDGDGVLTLDAETGAELGRISGPKAGGQVKWMAMENGILAMLCGETDNTTKPAFAMAYPANPNGTLLAAYTLADGKQLWQQETSAPVDERMVAVNGGKLYGHAAGSRSFCLDLKTGKLDWANSEASLLENADSRNKKTFDAAMMAQRGLIATDQALVLGMQWSKSLTVLSPQSGGILSLLASPGWGRAVRGFIRDGKWNSGRDLVDLETGKSVGNKSIPGDGCGPSTAAPAVLVGGFGQCVDAASGKLLATVEIKSPCDMGTVVSEGLIVTPPSTCRCNLPLWGYRAMTSSAGLELTSQPPMDGRLSAQTKVPAAPLSVSPADWPTYRANNARTGAIAVKAPTTMPVECWRWSPTKPEEFAPSSSNAGRTRTTTAPEFSPTPPIAAAGKVWFGDASGVVRCLEAADGKLRWSFPIGAKLFAAPSLAEGRLYVGAGDGWIYCLDAATGRELWRFHAAPYDRELLWYGHLISTWPVVTGVLVQDGVAYAAAGYQGGNGVYVYALDAQTGQVRWENHDMGVGQTPTGYGAMGTMAIAQGRLWMASGSDVPLAFDLKTGSLTTGPTTQPLKAVRRGPLRGEEVALYADRFILFGGRRLGGGYDERTNPGGGTGFAFMGLKDNGAPQDKDVLLLPNSTLPPVWDAELTVVGRVNSTKLQGWSTPKVLTALQDAAANGKPGRSELPEFTWSGKPATAPAPTLVWTALQCDASATALASNAVLVAHVESNQKQLSGLDRSSGQELWSLDLPSEPVFNGLALDRQGQVLVALRDGSLVCYGVKK